MSAKRTVLDIFDRINLESDFYKTVQMSETTTKVA